MEGLSGLYDPARSAASLATAREGIERYRKGDIRIRLIDSNGQPLAHLPVAIEQQQHAFVFGEGLWDLDAKIRDGEEHTGRCRAYKERFLDVLNGATNLCYWTERPHNDASKMEDRQGEPRMENFARTVDWCLESGIVAKGHPLFWSIDKCTPEWVKRYDIATQMKFAEVRVRNLVARFRGRVKIWDVVNEALWEPAPKNLHLRNWPYLETLENMAEYIGEVMRWCREEDPDACYLINDYGVENEAPQAPGSPRNKVTAASQRARYIELADCLRERGYGPDALGLQSHTGWLNDHAEQQAIYDAYGDAGWDVHVTEFWAHLESLRERYPQVPEKELDELHAEYVANYLTTAFGHPAVEAFFFWGFMRMAVVWGERSGHYLKPVFHRVKDLIHREWKTRAQLQTDADGIVSLRGFYGNYALRSQLPGSGLPCGQRFDIVRGHEGLLTLKLNSLPAARS